jgi:hypothetical protein
MVKNTSRQKNDAEGQADEHNRPVYVHVIDP